MLYAVKPITITKQWEIYQIGAEKLFVKKRNQANTSNQLKKKKMKFLIETLKKKQKNILN